MEGWGCESNGQAHGAGSTWALSVCVCHSGLAQLGERERVCTATVGWQLEMPAPNLVTLGSWRTVPGSTHAGTSTHTCACARAHTHTERHAYTCCTRRCAHRQAWAQKVRLRSWCRGFLFQQCLTAHPPTTELGFPQLPFSGPLLRGPCTGHGRGDAWAVLASVQESGALDGSPAGHMLAWHLAWALWLAQDLLLRPPAQPHLVGMPPSFQQTLLTSHRAAGERHTSSLPCFSSQSGIQPLWLLRGLYFPEGQQGLGSLPAPHSIPPEPSPAAPPSLFSWRGGGAAGGGADPGLHHASPLPLLPSLSCHGLFGE